MKAIKSIFITICLLGILIIPTSLYANNEEEHIFGTITNLWLDEDEVVCWGGEFSVKNGPTFDFLFDRGIMFDADFTELDEYVGEEVFILVYLHEAVDEDDERGIYLMGIYDKNGKLLVNISQLFKELHGQEFIE